MHFDKRLWLARWAGDEQRVREVSEALGDQARGEGDGMLQENLFEAQLTSAASEALSQSGPAAALHAVALEVGKRRAHVPSDRFAEALEAVTTRIQQKLRRLERQLAFKERTRKGHRELFVEERKELQDAERCEDRFVRVAHHPHGLELRSYLFTLTWVPPQRVAERVGAAGVSVLDVGQRAVLISLAEHRLVAHCDGRFHAVLPSRDKRGGIALALTLSDAVDELWS